MGHKIMAVNLSLGIHSGRAGTDELDSFLDLGGQAQLSVS